MRWASDSSFPYRAVLGNRVDTGWYPMAASLRAKKWSQMRKRAWAYTIITYIFNVSLLVIISDFSISSCDYHLVIPKSAYCGLSSSWWSSSRPWWSSSSWSAPSLFCEIIQWIIKLTVIEFMQQVNYSSHIRMIKWSSIKSMNSVIIGYNLFKCFVYVPSRKFASELWTF